MKIISVVGARPNFMKIAPFCHAIENYNNNNDQKIEHILVHTGQHYDVRMSESFFESLNIPNPQINLEIGSGSHSEQVGNTMIAFEKVLMSEQPDWVVVVGDVNATLSCSVAAKKLNINVCHIEAGLRSGDMTMPEEINRLVTDRLSDLLLTPDRMSTENLTKEGVPEHKISFVGNIMIDTLESNRLKAENYIIRDIIEKNLISEENIRINKEEIDSLSENNYAVATLHRPSNVDNSEILKQILDFFISRVTLDMPIVWTIHPRTQKMIKNFGLWDKAVNTKGLILLNPIGYHEMLKLNMGAKIMLTDSGGLQEECCVLGTPCLTLRFNTERPVTLKEYGGASVLVGNDIVRIEKEYEIALASYRAPKRPELWDGQTAPRCLNAIIDYKAV